ncbi:MAG: methyltransferase family protein [Candidatus Thorarchaeota archaeon]
MWFVVSLLGMLAIVPVHFLSVEHRGLEQKYGPERGQRIGAALGMISGWGIFLFYFGLWVSPQPSFTILPSDLVLDLLVMRVSVLNLVLGVFFLVPGAWLGIRGVRDLGLRVSETHRPERVSRTGLYGRMRHPQYLGATLSHLGVTLLLSSWFSLLVSPLVVTINYILCWKEETELVHEFGHEYETYQREVPMFLPRFSK